MKHLLLAALLLCFAFPALAAEKESVFERVLRTGTINCGYALWTPVLYKDANSGEIKGVARDVMDELGKRLNLKIVWKEEAGWGTIVEGLHTGRYDMICGPLANSSARAKFIDFSEPLFFTPINLIARKGDARFDKSYDALNDPQYKIAVLEGEISSIMARQMFPKAVVSAMPQLSDYSLLLKELETKKADVTLVEPATFLEYDAHNPGRLHIVNRDNPLNVFPASFGVPTGDVAFKRMIDVTVKEMTYDGTIGAAIKRHEKYPGTMLPPATPYKKG